MTEFFLLYFDIGNTEYVFIIILVSEIASTEKTLAYFIDHVNSFVIIL